jgi:hypothetical protein
MGVRAAGLNLTHITWTQPQICGDCHSMVPDGWQELKKSDGGPYIEKRCGPCAEVHYGNALPELVMDLPKKTKRSGKAEKAVSELDCSPLLLGLTG